jgi:acetyl-CoA carboxylase carboxyltransferase component
LNQLLADLEQTAPRPAVPPPGGDALLPVAEGRGGAVEAGIVDLHGHTVAWFRLAGGDTHGALGPVEGQTITTLVRRAVDAGVPVVGVLDTGGADARHGVASLHAWGTVARALTQASGVVPISLVVAGACVSGPALLLGLADLVVVTDDAIAYVSGPDTVEAMTGRRVSRAVLGGAAVHAGRSGVAHLVAPDEDEALALVADVLSFLPPNVSELPPVFTSTDPDERPCYRAAAIVPAGANQPYDVRELVADVVDDGELLELRPTHAPAILTGFARIGGRPVGIVANQPLHLAGTLDIDASKKAARFVRFCDSFGVPLVTFVDTPGFLPGVEQEWRGMIRHGAQLAFAYALASVPRLCVVVRKAYGGAYIVMDAKGMGNDLCVSWPGAELAVMGPSGAVAILNRRELAADPSAKERLEAEYAAAYCTPRVALERGYVDRLIEPHETRAVLARGLRALAAKRERLPNRKHENTPL